MTPVARDVPYGFRRCGCGQQTTVIKKADRRSGLSAGEPRHFRQGHQIGHGAQHMNYRGGRSMMANGYVKITAGMDKLEHVAIVERVLGHDLPTGAVVHHVDGDRAHNENSNLVACQDHAYHMLLHKRQRAFEACGNPNAERCVFCSRYDRQHEMSVITLRNGRTRAYHRACNAESGRRYKIGRQPQIAAYAAGAGVL